VPDPSRRCTCGWWPSSSLELPVPGKDGKFGQTDPSQTRATIRWGIDPEDPAGKDDLVTSTTCTPRPPAVIVDISSKDVIHSFNVPVCGVNRHIPGQRSDLSRPRKPATFELACGRSAAWATTHARGTC